MQNLTKNFYKGNFEDYQAIPSPPQKASLQRGPAQKSPLEEPQNHHKTKSQGNPPNGCWKGVGPPGNLPMHGGRGDPPCAHTSTPTKYYWWMLRRESTDTHKDLMN